MSNKQAAKQALPYAPHFMKEVLEQANKEPVIEPGEHVDKLMMELSQSEAWLVLKKYINEKRKRLEAMTRQSVRGDPFNLQNTGFRYMIFDQVDAFAEQIISRVESPAKVKKLEDEPTTSNK